MNRINCCAAIAASMFIGTGASVQAGGPVVTRDGSKLEATFTAESGGTWEIVDDQGHVCATGSAQSGENTVTFDKVSSPTDITFRVHGGGSDAATTAPGEKRLSPLAKPRRAVTIYQVPVRTYTARDKTPEGAGQFKDLTADRLEEIASLGVDYLWLTGVLEHASRAQTDPDVVKGDAGSYYAIYDHWDVSHQIGTLADFEGLIDRAHAAGLRVLVDFVANHTARMHRTDVVCKQHLDFGKNERTDVFFHRDNNYYHLRDTFVPPPQSGVAGADGKFDTNIFQSGIQLESPALVTGNNIRSATPAVTDWFETVKLNYGYDISTNQAHYDPRPRTWDQMLDVARYWVEKGVDGFRVDFAHSVPIEFWRYFATELRKTHAPVFLLAEAYEADGGMRLPNFSYQAMLEAGFDTVYNSEMYWPMRRLADNRGTMRDARLETSPALRKGIVDRGMMFTHYMENHDEVRVASREFAHYVLDRGQRANLGFAYTAYLGFLPGHLMVQGGQELQEDASILGTFPGAAVGNTSIFDFVYQAQTRTWLYGAQPQWMIDFRSRYKRLLEMKHEPAFSAVHSTANPSLVDLDDANGYKTEFKWVGAYVRFQQGERYLVVMNGDPFNAHEATIHLTQTGGQDTLGALWALGVQNDGNKRYKFEEVFARPGFVPHDPAIQGSGMPGDVLYRPGGVPSGLYLGEIPAATTYVFKVSEI